MDRYDENAFYYSPTENVWCWEQSSKGKIFKASSKSELLRSFDHFGFSINKMSLVIVGS